MDLGAVGTDGRADLIVGAPGGPGMPGAVYIIFGGPQRTGDFVLTSAETVITTSEVGNRFGAATAAGNILNTEGTTPRNLVVGAPGALGGRGAVYLFTAGFNSGASTTDASAVYRVLGAAGDQLGSALATGDLDNDGYREIIIGAPGTGRVYIVKGGPGLTGTLDLSSASAAQTITAAGIGRVLTAGDVTGDNIYDVIVGAPSQNLAFMYVGTNGAIPSIPVGSFSGLEAGDETGASVRILDLNGDGKRDLAISAPGGDGPANERASAGEVYLFLGPVGTGAMSVASANVVFFGSAAGARLGDGLTSGDVNRDSPNDLVLLASGGSSNSGELDIYYGRSTTSIGVVQPDGRRFVDFASPSQVSRRILGDPGLGPITSGQVFEVTGEGARDIIVGVAAAEAGAGKLFFTISPKLRITPTTFSLTVNQGGSVTSSTPVQVLNASTVVIGWQTSSNQPWLTASPAAGSADQTHPSQFYLVAASQGLAPGVHTGRVTVSSTSPDLEMALPVNVTLTVTGARVVVDAPADGATVNNGFTVTGWAIDQSAASGTGVSAVHVYAYPASGSPIFLGVANYGTARPDVASAYGARFTNSGFSLQVNNLTPGATYQLSAFAKSTVTGAFASSSSVNVTVAAGSPGPGPTPTDPNPQPPANPSNPPTNPNPGPTPGTGLSVNRSSLTFGALAGTNGVKTGPQSVTVDFASGSSPWTVTTDASWLELSTAGGSGSGVFTAVVKAGSYSAGASLSGTVTVTSNGVSGSPVTFPVRLNVFGSGGAPFGVIETPTDQSTGVVGSVPVTGWAIDDVGIVRVSLWRDPVSGETSSSPNGKIFIGNAVQVDGARPDVDNAYSLPFDYKAGWGYLLLTNMLPNQGNGTFVLHVYAEDAEGRTVTLGSRTISCDNANATRPFGSIDTPDQGGTISGTTYTNFGWALTPQPNAIPTDGSTIMVFIDGVPVGRPTYNQYRSDIATLFPGRANSDGAVGFFQFNTTTLSNGVHTIAWGVTDNNGNSEGIGSRYFTVLNGAASSSLTVEAHSSVQSMMGLGPEVRQASGSGAAAGRPAETLESVPFSTTPVYMRRGFSPSAALDLVETGKSGVTPVTAFEMDRFQLTLGAPVAGEQDGYEGYVLADGRLKPLPAGAFLDRNTGEFFWQPGVGFVGTYELVFVRTAGGLRERIVVEVRIANR